MLIGRHLANGDHPFREREVSEKSQGSGKDGRMAEKIWARHQNPGPNCYSIRSVAADRDFRIKEVMKKMKVHLKTFGLFNTCSNAFIFTYDAQ